MMMLWFVTLQYCAVLWCVQIPRYHHYAYLSEGIGLLKCLLDIFSVECVSQIRSVISIIFHAKYGTVCIQLTHFSYDDCENICTRSYYHHRIGSMTHLPLFRVRSWKNGMRCMSFYIFIMRFSYFEGIEDSCHIHMKLNVLQRGGYQAFSRNGDALAGC